MSTSPIILSVPTEPKPQSGAELYLDLLKKILTRALIAKRLERHTVSPRSAKTQMIHGLNRVVRGFGLEAVRLTQTGPENYLESGHETSSRSEDAETMLGTKQFDHAQRCIAEILTGNVPGDLLEAGVWRGGMTIFYRAALKAHQCTDRKVWVVDSFAGLPPIDRGKETFAWNAGDMAVSLETVKENFSRYGLLDNQVEFLKGFFSDTLPTAPIGPLAILRADADLYQSTLDVLTPLYRKLSPGGYAIFDDYQNLPDCRRAVDEFRAQNNILEPIEKIDQRAVFWRKLG